MTSLYDVAKCPCCGSRPIIVQASADSSIIVKCPNNCLEVRASHSIKKAKRRWTEEVTSFEKQEGSYDED